MKRLTGLIGLSLAGFGCATTPAPLPTDQAYGLIESAQCGHDDVAPQLRWLDNEYEWRAFAKLLHQQSGRLDPAAADVEVNFHRQRVLVVFQGRRPTPGYGLRLTAAHADAGPSARLEIQRLAPASGAILAQVVTSPCLAIALDRRFEHVTVDDGQSLQTVPVP